MPQAKDEAGNIWETDTQGNPIRLVQPAAQAPGPITIGQPDPYRDEDQEFERERLRIAQQQAAIAAQNAAVTAQNANKPPEGYRWTADGGQEVIPGGPADKSKTGAASLTAEARGKLEAQFGGAKALVNRIAEIERRFKDDFAGSGPGALAEYLPGTLRPENQQFEDAGRSLMGSLAAAFGLAAQQQNTPQELEIRFGPFIPKPGDRDEVILAKIERLKEIAREQGSVALQQLGREDEIEPFAAMLGGGGDNLTPPAPLSAAGPGATEQSIPLPPEMQAEYRAYLQQHAGRLDPNEYAAFRADLDRRYGFQGDPQGYRDFAIRANEAVQNGGRIGEDIPPVNEELSGVDRFRNDMVSNPLGAASANYFNAAGFGVPGLLDMGRTDALREANPVSATVGEIGGGVTGALLAGGGLGQIAGRIANPSIAQLLANPAIADMGYGAAYGATQAGPGDRLTGAAAGVAGALAGNFIGQKVGRGIAGLRGPKGVGPESSVTAGERRVLDAAKRTGIDPVTAALMKAEELGVPMTLADVSPEVNSLTGAALRRSPSAAGMARETLGQRSRGQYDRFLGAVERDLGDISNIPQRSEDLIAQASAAAGPLYDEAYSAPGAGAIFPNIEPLLNRPSMQRALARARTIAAEEGRDPTALGFDLDDAGNVVLNRVPSWQTLDYAKRGIDDVLESFRDKTTGRLVLDEHGRAIDATRRQFLQTVDAANPDYAAARAAYAGPAAERDALRRGQDALRLSPNQLGVNVANATPGQLDQMRLGFQSGLAENAGRVRNSTNPFESTLGTPAMEQRLATLYPDGDQRIARLLMQRDMERQLAGSTNRLIGNSATAERQLADEAFGQSSLAGDVAQGAIETAVTGAPIATALRSAAGRGVGGWMRDARTLGLGQRATELADEIAPIALNTDPALARAGLNDMQKRSEAYDAILEALLKSAGATGGHVGAGASSAVAAALAR